MKIRIKKQHLNNANYLSNTDYPLARALKGLGYRKVNVRGYTAEADRNGQRYMFQFDLNPHRIFKAQKAGNEPFTLEIQRTVND